MQRHLGRASTQEHGTAHPLGRPALGGPVRERPHDDGPDTLGWHDGAEARPAARGGDRVSPLRSLAWGVLGFLIGAVFWHFIGFWSFVSEIVFTGRPAGPERMIEQTGLRCVELVLDRETKAIMPRPCPGDAPLLNESAYAIREDFGGPRGARGMARSGGLAHIRLSADTEK